MKKLISHFVIKLLLSWLFLFDFSSANAAQPLGDLSASQMKGTVLGQCVYGGYCNGTSTKTAYNGVNYIADVGSPVYAVCNGTVKKAQPADRFIVIDHSNCGGFASLFAYYGNIDLGNFKTGSMVTAGQQIGTVAKSKNGGALHLSFNKSYVTSSLAYTPIGKTTLKDCTQESVTQRRTALDAKGYLDPILIGSQSSWKPVLLKGGDAKTGCEAPEQIFTSQTLPYVPFVKAPYTKIANNGSTLSNSAPLGANPTDWACTRDDKTGLIWEVKMVDGGLRDMNKTYIWDNSFNFAVDVNAQSLCGNSDWRMPTKDELLGIVKFGSTPTIDTTYFPNTVSNWFWSSSPSANFSSSAWDVGFDGGGSSGYGKDNYDYVRLVREDKPPVTAAYTKIANNGSILSDSAKLGANSTDWACTKDNNTGLIWEVKTTDGGLRDMNNVYSHYTTDYPKCDDTIFACSKDGLTGKLGDSTNTDIFVSSVNKQTLCGATDWRLPTKTELEGLVYCSDGQYNKLAEYDYICKGNPIISPTINATYFPNTQTVRGTMYRTSYSFTSMAWVIDFSVNSGGGALSSVAGKDGFIQVRLVR
jgi:hypothetical protein